MSIGDLLQSSVMRWGRRGKLVAPTVSGTPSNIVDGEIFIDSGLGPTRQINVYSGGAVRALEVRAEKDAANGYVGLDGSGLLNPAVLGPELSAIDALTSATDRLPYFTGSGAANLATFTSAARTLIAGASAEEMVSILSTERVFKCKMLDQLGTAGTFQLVSGKAYFTYLGPEAAGRTLARVRVHLSNLAVTVTNAEVGIFTTPNAPGYAGQTLTKVTAGNLEDLTSGTGMKKNSSAFATSTANGVHVWVGILVSASTMPVFKGGNGDYESGYILTTASATAFSSGSTWTGAIETVATPAMCPILLGTVD